MDPGAPSLRIDKWLWAARLFKTRSAAHEAIEMGRVRVAGNRIKPSHAARIGETLEIAHGETRVEIVVRALSARRGPAPQARELYEETEASRLRREQVALVRKSLVEPAREIKGRPTKRQGRDLRRLRTELD